MFTTIRIRGVSWTHVLSAVSFWVSLLIRKATDAVILQLDVSVFMDVTFIKDEIFFSDTPKHVLQGETSSEGHSWLDLQGEVVLDSLIQREEPTKPTEPAELDTLAEPATPVEPTILTDVTVVTNRLPPMKLP